MIRVIFCRILLYKLSLQIYISSFLGYSTIIVLANNFCGWRIYKCKCVPFQSIYLHKIQSQDGPVRTSLASHFLEYKIQHLEFKTSYEVCINALQWVISIWQTLLFSSQFTLRLKQDLSSCRCKVYFLQIFRIHSLVTIQLQRCFSQMFRNNFVTHRKFCCYF